MELSVLYEGSYSVVNHKQVCKEHLALIHYRRQLPNSTVIHVTNTDFKLYVLSLESLELASLTVI